MEKYHYTKWNERCTWQIIELLTDETVGRSTDRAVLLDYRAACEEKTEKAIKLEKEAIALIPEISEEKCSPCFQSLLQSGRALQKDKETGSGTAGYGAGASDPGTV